MLTHSPQRGGGQGFGQQCTALLWAVHHLLGCRACSAGFKHCTGSMLCITIMGPIAGLHSPCAKKHTPIRVREKNPNSLKPDFIPYFAEFNSIFLRGYSFGRQEFVKIELFSLNSQTKGYGSRKSDLISNSDKILFPSQEGLYFNFKSIIKP